MFADRTMRQIGSENGRSPGVSRLFGLPWIGPKPLCLMLVCALVTLTSLGAEHRHQLKEAKAVDEAVPHPKLIEDPCLGLRWTVAADAEHRDWPPRLSIVAPGEPVLVKPEESSIGAGANRGVAFSKDRDRIVIHPGDLVLVEQDSPGLHALLQGNALNPAVRGDLLRVRLRFGTNVGSGGMIIVVVATQEGRAQWKPDRKEGDEFPRRKKSEEK